MSRGWWRSTYLESARENAVKDVLERDLSITAAAVLWGVQRDDLERSVEEARNGDDASSS